MRESRKDESDEVVDPLKLIGEIEDGALSDLRPEEIPDDCVSDVEITASENLEQNTG